MPPPTVPPWLVPSAVVRGKGSLYLSWVDSIVCRLEGGLMVGVRDYRPGQPRLDWKGTSSQEPTMALRAEVSRDIVFVTLAYFLQKFEASDPHVYDPVPVLSLTPTWIKPGFSSDWTED